MNQEKLRVDAIFLAAAEKSTEAERSAYLAGACGSDVGLRARLDRLLAAHGKGSSFLESPAAAALVGTIEEPPFEHPGTVIGPYKLLEQIGEGGFGVVFMAEQQEPIRRKVALKVIKPGMDTRQVIARFEAERQALALMDHPHIAKVLDAGTTGYVVPPASEASGSKAELHPGRPYFVMELVRGLSITHYCDQHKLAVHARLELFIDVCQAVQHAHQKGIIHRDIKPSNVLITLHDGKPVVKVIDFGIAKAMGQQLTDKTLFTNFAQMIGTPLYMSPEQAELSGLDFDTRCDIYSLGVLLYELLTGTTPFDQDRLHQVGLDEIRRIIREEEPPKPSTRMSTVGQAATTASESRQSDPRKLSRLFRGELDWIVMKALEKDRNRRYETASAFVADVRRYLDDEPVLARPQSAWYRFRKLARRNRAALAVGASAVFLVIFIVAGLVTGMVFLDQANKHIGEKRDEAQRQQQLARDAVDDMYSDVAEEWLKDQGGLQPVQKKFLQKALRYYEEFTKNDDADPEMRKKRGVAYSRIANMEMTLGNFRKASEAHVQAAAVLEQLVAEFPENRGYRLELVRAYTSVGVLVLGTQAESSLKRAVLLAHELEAAANDEPEYWLLLARGYNCLACLPDRPGRPPEMESNTRQYLVWAERLFKEFPEDPNYQEELANAHNTLGELLKASSRFPEAEKEYRQAIELEEGYLARSPTNRGRSLYLATFSANLGEILTRTGRAEQAEKLYLRSVALNEKLIEDFPDSNAYRENLATFVAQCGDLYVQLGRLDDALKACRRVVTIRTKIVEDIPGESRYRDRLARAHFNLGQLLPNANETEQAIGEFSKAIELNPDWAGWYHRLALAQAMSGNLTGYRSVCDTMLDRFGRTLNPDVATTVAWTLAVVPDAVNAMDQVVRLAEMSAGSVRKGGYSSFTLGAALYRSGRFEEAIQQLNKASAECALGARADSPAIPWFFLAMAHHRLDHGQEARNWLAKAVTRIEQEAQTPTFNQFGNWTWRLMSQLLRCESEALVKGSETAPDKSKVKTLGKLPKR